MQSLKCESLKYGDYPNASGDLKPVNSEPEPLMIIETQWHGGDATAWVNVAGPCIVVVVHEVFTCMQLIITAFIYVYFNPEFGSGHIPDFSTIVHFIQWLAILVIAELCTFVFCVLVSVLIKWLVLGKTNAGTHAACSYFAVKCDIHHKPTSFP